MLLRGARLLFKIDLKTFDIKHYGTKEGLTNLNINAVFTDTKNAMWIGTYDGGLIKLKTLPTGDKVDIESIFKNEGREFSKSN